MTPSLNHESVQEYAWPEGTCYGCGPANPDGLGLESHLSDDGDSLVATYEPSPERNAGTPNVMYGGLIASLIDCHSLWTAIAFTHRAEDRPLEDDLALHVTAELTVEYLKPTPLDRPVNLEAWIDGDLGRKMRVKCELRLDNTVTATGDVIAARVEPNGDG